MREEFYAPKLTIIKEVTVVKFANKAVFASHYQVSTRRVMSPRTVAEKRRHVALVSDYDDDDDFST